MKDPVIQLERISKSFGAIQALNEVSFSVSRGSVHAVVGENGAGKSTLMKILMGIHQPEAGRIIYEGRAVVIPDPVAALGMGLALVFQEIELCPNLPVYENLFLGRELGRKWRLDRKTMVQKTEQALAEVGLSVSPYRLVETLSVAQKQLVQLARALLYEPRVLILDEPTSALARDGVDSLFRIIRRLHEQGVTILYISHKLEEIFEVADTATVLKDGRVVDTVSVSEVSVDELVSMMVGRQLDFSKRRVSCEPGACLLEVEGLSGEGFENVSLRVAAGEIVGIAGLVGSGRTELVETIFGVRPARQGRVRLGGLDITDASTEERIRGGMALVPEDRQTAGLIFALSLRENLTLPAIALARLGWFSINRKQQVKMAKEAEKQMGIVGPGLEAFPDSLSGGNQQKVVIGKWLGLEPRLLILDEPTRGIDVAAKAQVHDFIREMADRGHACLVVSSELPEILALADRIYVMHEGRMKGELPAESATEEQIMTMALTAPARR